MAPFTGGDTPDNNRTIHSPSYAGDNTGAEGATPDLAGSLTQGTVTVGLGPSGLPYPQKPRQFLPDPVQQGSVRLQSGVEDGCYTFGPPTGEAGLLNADTDDPSSRQAVPTPNPTGTIPTATDAGDHGAGFFGSTAPQKFPQFPKDPPAPGTLSLDVLRHT